MDTMWLVGIGWERLSNVWNGVGIENLGGYGAGTGLFPLPCHVSRKTSVTEACDAMKYTVKSIDHILSCTLGNELDVFMPLRGQSGRQRHYALLLSVRSSVCPFFRS